MLLSACAALKQTETLPSPNEADTIPPGPEERVTTSREPLKRASVGAAAAAHGAARWREKE
jgi:hypothetical protein